MTQPYGCDTFEYCAFLTRLCSKYVGSGTKSTMSAQLCTLEPIMQKYALSPNFDTIGLR